MRELSELFPDVQIAAPGAPIPVVIHALTRALSDFLTRSEAWREWSYEVDPDDIVTAEGVWDFEKYIAPDDPDIGDYDWLRTKRVDSLLWDTKELCFVNHKQLGERDPQWRSREGTTPTYYTFEGPGGGRVRFVQVPNGTDYDADLVVRARLVLTTNVTNTLDEQVPQIPDWLFEQYREILTSGALAILYRLPGRAWTDNTLASAHATMFEDGVIRARSHASYEFGKPLMAVRFNPDW